MSTTSRERGYSHVYRHVGFRDGVHGRTDQGCLQGDLLCDFALEDDGRGRKVDVSRQDEKVVVSQSAVDFGVHEVCGGEAVGDICCTEDLICLCMIEDLCGRGSVDAVCGGRHLGTVGDGRGIRAAISA